MTRGGRKAVPRRALRARVRAGAFLGSSGFSFTEKTQSFNVTALPVRSTASVECPKGEHVFGGGVSAAASSVFLVASFPIDGHDLDKRPDDGSAGVRGQSGRRHDRPRSPQCGARGRRLSQPELHGRPGDQSTSSALCSHGQHVTGGGVDWPPPPGDGLIEDTFPGATREWAVFIDNYSANPAAATAYATCAKGDFTKVQGGFFQVPDSVSWGGPRMSWRHADDRRRCPKRVQRRPGLPHVCDQRELPGRRHRSRPCPRRWWRAETISFASGLGFSEAIAIRVK